MAVYRAEHGASLKDFKPCTKAGNRYLSRLEKLKAGKLAEMTLPSDGYILVVKRDCPTCRLISPVAKDLSQRGLLADLMSQDDPDFPEGLEVTDDRGLEGSWQLGIDIVPTLIRRECGKEVERVIGWHREEWQNLTGVNELGTDLPEQRPGCGSLSVAAGMAEELQTQFGETGLVSRTIPIPYPKDEAEQMFDRGWTDGLPVVSPTAPRVLRMLQGTNREPSEVIGDIPPALASCTVEKAAINSVMAGCRPEYFPVVLAALEAALDPDFAWYGLLSTTMGVGPVVVVNGPIAKRIGMNWGFNALGQGNRPNATIARALQLIARNVGGAIPGGIDRTTIGHPGKFGVCFAEDETDAAWEPLSASRGIARGTSAVTTFAGCGATVFTDQLSRNAESLARSLAKGLEGVVHPKSVGNRLAALLVLSPEHWNVFKRDGWARSDIEAGIVEAGKRPGRELVRGADGIEEGMPESWAEGEYAKFNPENLLIAQAGSHAGLMSAVITGWSAGPTGSIPITREVKL